MLPLRLLLPPAAALLLFACAAGGTAGSVAPPFDPAEFRSPSSSPRPGARCATPVPAARDMSRMGTFYNGDKTQSVIDRAAMGAYVRRTARIDQFKVRLRGLSDRWVALPAERPAISRCIVGQLRAWADAGAMLGGLSDNDSKGHRQAILVISWAGPAIGNAYALADAAGTLSAADRRAIAGWSERLSREITSEFAGHVGRPRWLEGSSNHRYWGAAALASLASVSKSRADLDQAMSELRDAIAAARPDGGLPRELGRGGRAVHYQSFAMVAIAVLVRSADRNRVALSADEEARLATMARFSAAAWETPAALEAATGRKQEINGGMLAWVDILLPHLRRTEPALAKRLDALAAPHRPFEGKFIGVDISAAR